MAVQRKYLPKGVVGMRNMIVKIIPQNSPLFKLMCLIGFKVAAKQKHTRRTSMKIDIPAVEHCNLSCKGCTAFGPIAKESFLDVDSYEKDMSKLSELTNHKLDEIWFTGGEPLLHPRIAEMVQIARKYFYDTSIKILSNGILLLKMPDDFWKKCRDNQIEINITKYPVKVDFEKISEIAQKHGITFGYLGGDGEPVKEMWKYPLDLLGQQKLKNSFMICNQVNSCIRMKNGRIYPCNTIPCIEHFNSFFGKNLEVTEKDYIEIEKVKSIDEVYDFLIAPKPFCKYCNRKGVVFGIKWAISKKELSEWV
jgi:MoaA/NifB/PqqE/SkfB family radical SAM enzyme